MNIQMVCMVCGSASVEVSGYMATISRSAHIEFIKCKIKSRNPLDVVPLDDLGGQNKCAMGVDL